MNYGGNMPDWHQYNSPQAGISDVTSTAQNVNSGHLPFISSINSSCPTQLNGLNLGSDGLEKHQSDPNFNPRHFQQHLPANLSHGHNATDNAPLASMVQMQNCIGHYGPSSTRNPMVDNLNGPMDPRNTAMTGLNEELSYRSNQVPLSGPMSHMNGPSVMSMSAPHGPIGPRSANASSNSHAASRTGPPPPSSFVACKAPCCNPDPNYQQWEKYCSYQNNAYRENIRTNGYQADARRFGGDFNFRKDNFDGKEILPPASAPNASDHRRNFPDFKYRKERAVSRSYPSNSGMLHSYPSMQNYNYAGDYQKYPYPNIKEYPKANSMSVPPSQSMVKHQQEQSFAHQQKYNKSMSYQNNGAMMSTSVPNPNMLPSAQNSYFNSQQYPRNPSTDTSQHDCQAATNDSATTMMNARMQPSNMHAQYQQVYQQKLAMQRFSMENHLREMTRIPGYQSHPKYKECVLRYREILKLQQSVAYQGQMPSQPQTQQSCVAATTVNTAVPSINLQFDQNGVLINSNYIPEGFPRMQQVSNSQASDNLVDKQGKQDDGNPAEMMNHNVQKREQLVSQQHDNQAIVLCAKGMQPQDRYSVQKNLNQSQFEMQAPGNEDFSDLSASASDAAARQKMPKQFADKPELDVRQFLANWDESEDEDGANANLPSAVLSDSTPVVVVGYENVDLSAKTLEGLEGSKSGRITTDVITFENQDKSNVSVMPAQDCLTISYASAENVEVTKDPACKEIAKESIVQPGSHIIQCISNGPDEVPTIHIVDNLEIGSILQVTNGQVTETLGGQDALSFLQDNAKVQASTITIETDKFKKTNGNSESAADYNASKEEYVVENSSPAEAVEGGTSQAAQGGDQRVTALPASVKSNLDSAQDVNLKKQNSFASEESHNPDDISLPDLHTSECTPISTTLNTPIHSDTEESSERVQDLTISTNPIEIIQNSPMISFTQSPTKSEPYDHLSNEGEARNRSAGSLESRYQAEDRNNDVLDHDAVLGTFEFSANVNKDESTAENGKESASLNGDAVSANNSGRTFLDGEAERSEATSVCMTLTSGEYELKIVSAQNVGTSSKSTREYKSSSLDCHANESQTAAVGQDASTVGKKLQVLPERGMRNALRYGGSRQLDEALQNITGKSDSVERRGGQDDVHYDKRSLTDLNRETATNDTAPIASKTAADDNCSTKIVKTNPSALLGAKRSTSSNDKLRKRETSDKSAKEDSSSENNGNKSLKIDAKDLKNSWQIIKDHKKSILNDQANSHHARKCSPANATEKSNEIMHQDKHRGKSDILRNKPRIIDNVSIDDSGERMRLLKEYRRIKHKSSTMEIQGKSKVCSSSDPDEHSVLQVPSDKQLCQKDGKFKLAEEREKKNANILKKFVTKNVNPDFAIQVTNVNLKRKDNDEQKESQRSGEETKNSGPLDAIKIEINVSCTERNTTEKLLHENIKNAVAETIGHLTSSISSGARSNSANLKEIQCDKDGLDGREKRNRSQPEASTYNEVRKDQSNAEVMKYKSLITACKEDIAMDETSGSLIPRKKRSSSSERELIHDNGNISINTETALSSAETLKPEHAMVRRRSIHQDTERKAVAANFSGSDDLKTPSEKKEYQEATVASACRNVRNLQDDIASRLNAIPSTSSSTVDPSLENANYDNPTHFDYNHFDVAPNENLDVNDKRTDRWKRPRKDDGKFNNFEPYETASVYVNPIFFSADKLENLNTVPVYTTKDGKITYSPNPRFTYRELLMEARAKDNYGSARESSYFASSPLDYNCSRLRKVFKRNREVLTAIRKRSEIDFADGKLQSAAKHVNYLPNKNAALKSAHCAKARGTPHLEFFNDDADKLYANRNSQQDGKESNKKSIGDLSFLEKQYNLNNEPAPSTIKHCKAKMLADNLNYEKEYGENVMFDSHLFLGSRAACWEETMESVKSYSSHVDRRNKHLKELNFSEVFAAQRRLDLLPFLSAEQEPLSGGNNDQKTGYNVANELISNPAACDYNIDNLSRGQAGENDPTSCKQSDVIPLGERNECDKQNAVSTTKADDYPPAVTDQCPEQESQPDEIQSDTTALVEEARSCSSKAADKNTHGTEEGRGSPSDDNDQETLEAEHLTGNDAHVHGQEDKSAAESANAKRVSNSSPTEVALPESNAERLSDEPKCTEATEESALNDADEVDDSAKNNSDSAVDETTACQEVSSAPVGGKANDEDTFMAKSISPEVDFGERNEQNGACSEETSKEPIVPQGLSDVALTERPQLDEEDTEQQSRKLDVEREVTEASSLGNEATNVDEVDDCNAAMTPKPVASLDLLAISTEKSVCDLFTSETPEQNISEFTVIKSIIAGDKKNEHQEPETKDGAKVCDSMIDSKLLCMDSSDCGIYAEDKCALTRMSEHDFTEEDSMVPMEWETSQIQEDAVNRLCSMDESSIDFAAAAANSLQDSSLLHNLSLSIPVKESTTPETAVAIESRSSVSAPAIEPPPEMEKMTPSNEGDKEQASSSEHEKMACLPATDCNAGTKMVPKLVIKKSDIDNMIHKSLLKRGCQPKIPKMIIRNARSRPGTPSIESVHEEVPVQINISDRMSRASEEPCENDSESSLQESNDYRSKIPKMKIKLDDKHSNKIMRAEDTTELSVKRKNIKKTIPKVKIKNSSRIDLSDNSVCSTTSQDSRKSLEKYEEKIPILKLKKQERNRSSSPEASRKRQGSSHSEMPSKKCKRSGRDETGHSTRRGNFPDSRTVLPECETSKSPLACISEKIPKVIIKRTSASAEFKCELSKGCKDIIAKSAKWQPAVKLERYQVLDSIVKDLKASHSSISARIIDKIFAKRRDSHHQGKKDDYKLSRSSSMSNLLPVKHKQRRMSDYDCRKPGDADGFTCALPRDSSDSRTCTASKKTSASCRGYHSDNKRRSRSRDNHPQVETGVTSSDKEVDRPSGKSGSEKATPQHDEHRTESFDTHHKQAAKKTEDETVSEQKLDQKSAPTRHSSSSANFKIALKELKTTPKIETCFVKLPDLNEISSKEISIKKQIKEQRDDPFLSKEEIVAIKKEPLSDCPSDVANNCNPRGDGSLLKDASVLDTFELDRNAVIKIESSDESQSTIEILPASPDGPDELESQIIEDGDSELYSADAIPTQFELELEIADHSSTDLLDVTMPKLDPVANYSSRCAPTKESCSNQIPKRYSKSELSPRSKNSPGRDKHAEVDVTGSDKSSPDDNDLINSAREVSPKCTCSEEADSTKRNFCCNDSLIKEVLAAKETLKKCLSKSRCENGSAQSNARPKTAAEKKQGSSFDLKRLSETHSKSSDGPQDCRDDVTSQRVSVSAAGKRNKTETTANTTTEKSDQKHSKQGKSCSVREKSSEKRDKESHPKETTKDARECTTSLETLKRATSNEGPTRTICLGEKRRHSANPDNGILQLQDSQRKELSAYKIPKISRSTDQGSNAGSKAKDVKPKMENMPILEPEIAVSFDANSDADSSRSPPMITHQDGDLDVAESKLVDEKIITLDSKETNDIKDMCKKGEISITDFITQLACHEKATIKHRRYCNLCERWFPTTSRHRRHLAGYQHRHIELTQRRSIHALFMLFTGKPCPRLLPANVARNDCSLGELTPLQIAVQDVIKSFDDAPQQESPRKQNDVDK
ncbi:hypothetical protein DMN91_012143 [Ooceraea biroi]|uniref:C2H2-type domain-containing protein n=1 Tax=Ooceraea biroi TaxID=2015173 RepID=A0A3L8D4H8_OOCBI|nr:uncharacterized protein LOC105286393 [Ooceraea biroi]XP_011349634.2 uncharacterized protein LOC105286393 [Ooceraea biroi]RLU15149.1 hypothetical protein DMN91_012143 [Ooceraea biroi]